MRRSEIQEILVSRGWLAEIDPALATAVVQAGRPMSLRKGELLYTPEDNPGGMFGVISGGMLMATLGAMACPCRGISRGAAIGSAMARSWKSSGAA